MLWWLFPQDVVDEGQWAFHGCDLWPGVSILMMCSSAPACEVTSRDIQKQRHCWLQNGQQLEAQPTEVDCDRCTVGELRGGASVYPRYTSIHGEREKKRDAPGNLSQPNHLEATATVVMGRLLTKSFVPLEVGDCKSVRVRSLFLQTNECIPGLRWWRLLTRGQSLTNSFILIQTCYRLVHSSRVPCSRFRRLWLTWNPLQE